MIETGHVYTDMYVILTVILYLLTIYASGVVTETLCLNVSRVTLRTLYVGKVYPLHCGTVVRRQYYLTPTCTIIRCKVTLCAPSLIRYCVGYYNYVITAIP